jgi:hypothetical protein
MYDPRGWAGVEVDAKGRLSEPIPDNAAQVVRALRVAHVEVIRITPHPDWSDESLLIVVGANPDN